MASTQDHINQIRNFNRFYTSVIGLLDKHIYQSAYSLSEARILFEISKRRSRTARQIKEIIKMDEGYLSRIVEKFASAGIIKKSQSEQDARVYNLSLTNKGRKILKNLNDASDHEVATLVSGVAKKDIEILVKHMEAIVTILSRTQ